MLLAREHPHHDASWTFLTNHAHVLVCLAEDPDLRLRDVAERVGITERAVQRIVSELEDEGYLRAERVGRRKHYTLALERPLRHPVEDHVPLGALLALVLRPPGEASDVGDAPAPRAAATSRPS